MTVGEEDEPGRAGPGVEARRDGPTVSLRVDFPTGARVGPGKIALLEAVGRTGSISAAGRSTGMSYRRAWLLLDDLNRAFDRPVTAASAGGAGGGGAAVTEFGRALIAAYRALEADVDALSVRHMAPFVDALDPAYAGGGDAVDDGEGEPGH
jgi:molybdate transport system regulatory protein